MPAHASRAAVRRWLWLTFVYDRMWMPANWAQAAWVKTRGYPLPRWLIPPCRTEGDRPADLLHVSSSYWTPVGQLIQASRLRRRGFAVRLRFGR